MLVPAKRYEEELNIKLQESVLDKRFMWYELCYNDLKIELPNTDYNDIYLVSIDSNKNVCGFLKAAWRRPENYIDAISCVNFEEENNLRFAVDIKNFISYLINDLNIPKIFWNVAVGNPVEKAYDKFCKKHGGRIVGVESYAYLIRGKFYSRKMYEWINHKWVCSNCGHIERKEREVMCWECGIGEMIYKNPFNCA